MYMCTRLCIFVQYFFEAFYKKISTVVYHNCYDQEEHNGASFSFNNPPPQCGVVRYGGTTEFAPGQWIGVELEEEIGKNDGSYGGIRYFSCRPKHGEGGEGEGEGRGGERGLYMAACDMETNLSSVLVAWTLPFIVAVVLLWPCTHVYV